MSIANLLLVEDDFYVRDSLTDMLTYRKYKVIHFSDGLQAKRFIKDQDSSYDLALFDLSLPNVDGDELIELSKAIFPSVPVVIFSSYNFKPKKADASIEKPFGHNELLTLIQSLLDKYADKSTRI